MKKSQAKQAKQQPQKGKKKQVPKEGRFISAPVSQGQIRTVSPGKIISGNSGDGRIRVAHTEYIADVIPSVQTFVVDGNLSVNPGLDLSFPWLSHMAYNYESYRFIKLKYEFRSAVGSQTAGRVMMFMDYDSADAAPATKQMFLSNHEAVSAPIWGSCDLNCDKLDLLKSPQRYNRYGVLAANLDVKTYDTGRLYVATCGISAANVGVTVGEIFVSYVVELITPQLNYLAEIEAGSKRVSSGGAVDKANPFGTTPALAGGLDINVPATDVLHFADTGEYILNIYKVGTGLVNTVLTSLTVGITATVLNAVRDAASTSEMMSARVKVDNPGTVRFDTTGGTTLTSLAVRIAPYLYALV